MEQKNILIPVLTAVFLFRMAGVVAAQGEENEETPADTAAHETFFHIPFEDLLRPQEYEDYAREADSLLMSRRRIDFPSRDITGPGGNPGAGDLHSNVPLNFRYNRVDGLYIGVRSSPMSWSPRFQDRIMKMYGSFGYGFRSRNWQYTIGVERLFGYNRNLKLGVLYRNTTHTEDMWRTAPVENTLTSLFAGYDFLDYYEVEGIQPYAVLRTGSYLEHTLAFKSEDHFTAERNTRFNFFGGRSHVRGNPAIDEGLMQQFVWTTSLHSGGFVRNERLAFSGDIRAELGNMDWLDSDFDFNRYELELRSDYIVDPSAMLRIRGRVGTSTGILPDQKHFALGGIGTMRGRSYKNFQGSDMLLLNTELHFSSRHRRERPDTDGFQVDWGEFLAYVFLDAGWVNEQFAEQDRFMEGFDEFQFSDIRTDVGLGISLPASRFNAIRFELAWPTSEFGQGGTFWVRFNPTF